LKIFVCEFITGGGLYREPLPPSLVREGDMMLQALLADLRDVPGAEVTTTRDARLPPLSPAVSAISIVPSDDVWQRWEASIAAADAVWPIAPESGGVLERLSRLVIKHDKILLNSTPDAVAIAASKTATAHTLSAAGVATVPTHAAADWNGSGNAPWVAKPDDGVGCDDTRLFDGAEELRGWLSANGRMQTHIVQPYLAGESASLSLLIHEGDICLLSCNRQLIDVRDGMFRYHGSILNDASLQNTPQHWQACEAVAKSVARTITGLDGYVGIDVLIQEGAIVVVEVNPRLTTSYAGLRRATECNPARLVVDMIYNKKFSWPWMLARNVVQISVNE